MPLPRANAKSLLIWPRDVPENGDPRVRSFRFDQPGQQCKMVVLHQDHGFGRILNFLEKGYSKFAIHFLILLPVLRAEDGARVRDMTKGPKPFVGKSIVVTFFLLLA